MKDQVVELIPIVEVQLGAFHFQVIGIERCLRSQPGYFFSQFSNNHRSHFSVVGVVPHQFANPSAGGLMRLLLLTQSSLDCFVNALLPPDRIDYLVRVWLEDHHLW